MMKIIKDVGEFFEKAKETDQTSRAAYKLMPNDLRDLLKPGKHAVRILDVSDDGDAPADVPIFYEIIESEYEEDRITMKNTPHLRLCVCSSVLCVEGEIGTVHVVGVLPIAEESFVKAKERSWDVSLEEVNFWVQDQLLGVLGKPNV